MYFLQAGFFYFSNAVAGTFLKSKKNNSNINETKIYRKEYFEMNKLIISMKVTSYENQFWKAEPVAVLLINANKIHFNKKNLLLVYEFPLHLRSQEYKHNQSETILLL